MHCHCFLFVAIEFNENNNGKNDETSRKLICARMTSWREKKPTKLLIFKAIQLTGKRQHCYLSFSSSVSAVSLSFSFSSAFDYHSKILFSLQFLAIVFSRKCVFVCGAPLLLFLGLDEWHLTRQRWNEEENVSISLSEFHKCMDIAIDSMYRFDSSLLFRCVFEHRCRCIKIHVVFV